MTPRRILVKDLRVGDVYCPYDDRERPTNDTFMHFKVVYKDDVTYRVLRYKGLGNYLREITGSRNFNSSVWLLERAAKYPQRKIKLLP